jgi:hypothetical protein
MKKIFIIFCIFSIAEIIQPTHISAASADSVIVINKTDSTITFVGSYSSNSILNSVIYKVADTINYFTYGPFSFFAGVYSDTITATGLNPGTVYTISMYVNDFVTVDSVVISDTTLQSPSVPAVVNNLLISNILQTGGTISVDYDAGGPLMTLQFWNSTDSINWSLWSTYQLYGSGTQSFFYAQSPSTKTYWIALGYNILSTVLDSSNVGVLETLPINASAPHIDSLFSFGITQNSGYINFKILIDSVILTICTVQSSLDQSFSTGVWTDSSFIQLSGNINHTVNIYGNNGYLPGQNIYVRVCAYNAIGSDTVYLSFTTNTAVFGPPTASMNAVINITQSSGELFANYTIGGSPYAMFGFQAAYANDTNVLFWFSTPMIDTVYNQSGVLHATVTGLPSNTAVAGQFFIFTPNTGIVFTPFVFFTTLGFTEVDEYIASKSYIRIRGDDIVVNAINKNSEVEIYSLSGQLVMKDRIQRGENKVNISNLHGMYIIRAEGLVKKFFH